MATITSEIQLFNLAVQQFGNYPDIESITSPTIDAELIFLNSWTLARHIALKELKPSFSINRLNIAVSTETPKFGYSYQYKIPSDCLAILGIGNAEDSANNSDYAIENGYIMTDLYAGASSSDSLPVRYIKDVSDVYFWTPEFIEAAKYYLAIETCMAITKDKELKAYLENKLRLVKINSNCLDSMENKPIKICKSKFASARTVWHPKTGYKK